MFDLEYIKNKLNNYGISFDNYIYQTGNLVGKVSVPNALRAYNKDLTPEQAFYLVANKVFELANLLAFGIPSRLSDDYKNVVGHEIYRDFQKAIYEEINQRFLSNTFPEFQNAGSVSISNTSIQSGYLGGPSITDWVNPMSKQIIANIDWRQFTDEANYQRDKVFMYRNMENALFPNASNKRIMQVIEDGSIALENKEYFATSDNLDITNTKLENTTTNSTNNTSEINTIKSLIPSLATKEYVDELVTAFPKTEIYDQEKTYMIPAFVVFNKKIYWNLQDNNLGHTPGGPTGQGWWQEITDIFIPPRETTIVYQAGTDIKKSLVNPNEMWYLDIQAIFNANVQNENDFFNLINNMFIYHNLTKEQTDKLFLNLCENDTSKLEKLYKPIKFYKGQKFSFDTKENADNFIVLNNLQETQYKVYEPGTIFGQGDYEDVVGDGMVKQSDLPDINFVFRTFDYYHAGRNNFGLRWNLLGYENLEIILEKTVGGWDIATTNGETTKVLKWTLRLNGGVPQTEYKPKYTQEYTICILENIYEPKEFNYYTNIVDLTIEGHIIKTQGIENNDINQIATSAYQEIVNDTKTRSIEPKKGFFGMRRK